MSKELIIYIDGASRGNPGEAGAGVVIVNRHLWLISAKGYYLGEMTNNQAEYHALLKGLEEAKQMGAKEVFVRSDSELLVKQMNGEYRVKNKDLRVLFEKARQIAQAFDICKFEYIPREHNTEADRLANRAINLKAAVKDCAL
ncbi:MAG: ribonuclease H [Thermoplasmata archaeon]|nr:MAG: ribonuclease H [Thermoplasmata archaeon]